MKVFILITDAAYDYEPCRDVQAFESLEAAQTEMEALIQEFILDENDMNWTCAYHDDKSCLYQE